MHARNSMHDTIRVHGYLFMYGILAYFFLWIFLGFWFFQRLHSFRILEYLLFPSFFSIPPPFLFYACYRRHFLFFSNPSRYIRKIRFCIFFFFLLGIYIRDCRPFFYFKFLCLYE